MGKNREFLKGLSQTKRGLFETVRREDELLREVQFERRNQEVFEVCKGVAR